jgi:hypothetical protein
MGNFLPTCSIPRLSLAVARKMVSYLLAVERGQRDFIAAEQFSRTAAA